MSEKKHTPGPWKLTKEHDNLYAVHEANPRFKFSERGYDIAQVFGGMPLNEFEANAELIASAPQLAERVSQLEQERDKAQLDAAHDHADYLRLQEENERLKAALTTAKEEIEFICERSAHIGMVARTDRMAQINKALS